MKKNQIIMKKFEAKNFLNVKKRLNYLKNYNFFEVYFEVDKNSKKIKFKFFKKENKLDLILIIDNRLDYTLNLEAISSSSNFDLFLMKAFSFVKIIEDKAFSFIKIEDNEIIKNYSENFFNELF